MQLVALAHRILPYTHGLIVTRSWLMRWLTVVVQDILLCCSRTQVSTQHTSLLHTMADRIEGRAAQRISEVKGRLLHGCWKTDSELDMLLSGLAACKARVARTRARSRRQTWQGYMFSICLPACMHDRHQATSCSQALLYYAAGAGSHPI